jgi:hypothetical protein
MLTWPRVCVRREGEKMASFAADQGSGIGLAAQFAQHGKPRGQLSSGHSSTLLFCQDLSSIYRQAPQAWGRPAHRRRYHQNGGALSERIYKLQPTGPCNCGSVMGVARHQHISVSSERRFRTRRVYRSDPAVRTISTAPRLKHLPDTIFPASREFRRPPRAGALDSPKYRPSTGLFIRPDETTAKIHYACRAVGGTPDAGRAVIEDKWRPDRIPLIRTSPSTTSCHGFAAPTAAEVAAALASQINGVN